MDHHWSTLGSKGIHRHQKISDFFLEIPDFPDPDLGGPRATYTQNFIALATHRAMFKLGAKNLFLLCLLVKNMPADYSADRCNFWESETDCSRNGNNLYKSWVERALNSGQFGHFRFANHHCTWQIFIKVGTSAIGLSCLMRTILEFEKVRQIWTLLLGWTRLGVLSFPVVLFGFPQSRFELLGGCKHF